MSDLAPTPTPAPRSVRAKLMLPVIAILTVGAMGALTTASYSQGFGPGGGGGPGYGRGMGGGMMGGWRHDGPGFSRGGAIDPAQAEARIDRMVRHVAVEIGASAEQQDKLSAIAKGVVKDVLPVREKMVAARQQIRDLLTAQTIDRTALDKLRADQIATHEAASKRVVQALADAAEVLNPDQRKKLNELIDARRGGGFGRGGWGHGWGMGGMMGGGMMGGWR